MDKDRPIEAGKQIVGNVKLAAGELVGDAKLQVDGKAENVVGKAQNDARSAKDTIKQ